MRSSKRIYKYCCEICGTEYLTHDKHSDICSECESGDKIIIIKESKEKTKFTFNNVEYLG